MCNQIKNLSVGKFYLIHDGSKTGHPGLIVWKNDSLNVYIAAKIGTSPRKDNIPLQQNITKNTKNYLYKRLFIGKRKDFGSKEFVDLKVTNEIKNMIGEIKNNAPLFSPNVSKFLKKTINIKKFL